MLPFPRSRIPLAALVLGLGAGESRAVPIDFSANRPRADFDSRIASNPYRYEFAHLDNVWKDPEGSWHHEYSIKNNYVISKQPPAFPDEAVVQWDELCRIQPEVPTHAPSPAAVPEPGTGVLLASGLAALAFTARRRRSHGK